MFKFRNPFKRSAKTGGKDSAMTDEEKAAAAKAAQDKAITPATPAKKDGDGGGAEAPKPLSAEE
jgi:hypothetical protein